MSPRVSSQQLARISRRLTDRDTEVLHLVWQLGVISSRHVEGFIVTDGSNLTRARRSRALLARLVDLGVLARLERRIGGVRAGSAGYLYRLSHAGRRLLGLPTGSGWREPGDAFLDHQLAAADLHLAVHQTREAGRIDGYRVEHEPDCWRRYTGPGGARLALKPDLHVEIDTGDQVLVWFVEIDRATESRTRVGGKIDQYLAYWRTGVERARAGTFPKVLWVCPDAGRAAAITEVARSRGQAAAAMHQAVATSRALELLSGGAS